MKTPPKRYLRKHIKNMRYYWGRVHSNTYNILALNIWERFGRYKEYFSNISLKSKGVTYTSNFKMGDPVEIWTWVEIIRGKESERCHLRKVK